MDEARRKMVKISLKNGTLQHAVVGELALDGSLRPIRGALPIAAWARRWRDWRCG